MKSIISGVIASVAALGLMAACSDSPKLTTPTTRAGGATVTLPAGETLPPGETLPTLPPGFTVPPGETSPTDFTIPSSVIDQMIAQFETAGIKVDKACFENLLKDAELRKLVTSAGTPTAEMIQRFTACFKQ